jgi:hypothetical protein
VLGSSRTSNESRGARFHDQAAVVEHAAARGVPATARGWQRQRQRGKAAVLERLEVDAIDAVALLQEQCAWRGALEPVRGLLGHDQRFGAIVAVQYVPAQGIGALRLFLEYEVPVRQERGPGNRGHDASDFDRPLYPCGVVGSRAAAG